MRSLLIVSIAFLSAACNDSELLEPDAIAAGKASITYAKKEGVDLDRFAIRSIRRLQNSELTAISDTDVSQHIDRVRSSLKGKVYWEVCYWPSSDQVAGATYCYFLEENSNELIAVLRLK